MNENTIDIDHNYLNMMTSCLSPEERKNVLLHIETERNFYQQFYNAIEDYDKKQKYTHGDDYISYHDYTRMQHSEWMHKCKELEVAKKGTSKDGDKC